MKTILLATISLLALVGAKDAHIESTPVCPNNPVCTFFETTRLRYPSDCTKYIQCWFGETRITDCSPVGFEFSTKYRECVPAVDAQCPKCTPQSTTTVSPTSTTTILTSTTTISTTTTIGPTTTTTRPTTTTTRPTTSTTRPTTTTTRPTTTTTRPTTTTTRPTTTTTRPTTTTTRPTTTTTPPTTLSTAPPPTPLCPVALPCVLPGLKLPYPSDCKLYYQCTGFYTAPDVKECGEGFLFSQDLRVRECVPSFLVKCPECIPRFTTTTVASTTTTQITSTTTASTTTSITTTTTPVTSTTPKPTTSIAPTEKPVCRRHLPCLFANVLLPYPSDCTKYVKCTGLFKFTIEQCPPSTKFSQDLRIRQCLLSVLVTNCPNCIPRTTMAPMTTTIAPISTTPLPTTTPTTTLPTTIPTTTELTPTPTTTTSTTATTEATTVTTVPTSTTTVVPTTTTPLIPPCPALRCLFATGELKYGLGGRYCNQFYTCPSKDSPKIHVCPIGTYFHVLQQQCSSDFKECESCLDTSTQYNFLFKHSQQML